ALVSPTENGRPSLREADFTAKWIACKPEAKLSEN
ncbi:MAG: hypothetical protein QOE55_6370, partial [Acidobacteriaceae bacterium]|nr:hypothetical protein [Acidobacteriaceae bacterium]